MINATTVAHTLLALILVALAVHGIRKTFYHFRVVESGRLYRSGLLNPLGLFLVTRLFHINTIINLRSKAERNEGNWFEYEENYCRKNNITFLNINLLEDMPPTRAEVQEFLDAVRQPGRRTLVHCEMGVIRTGMMVVAYAKHFLHPTDEEVFEKYFPLWGHSLKRRQPVERFVRDYRPDHHP